MSKSWLIFYVSLVTAIPVDANDRCVLPVADGTIEAPSAPNLEGVIASAAAKIIEVRPRDQGSTGQAWEIALVPETEIFTVYGGFVSPSQLLAGQHVKVWLIGCREKTGERKQEAAVVEIASKKPGEEFP